DNSAPCGLPIAVSNFYDENALTALRIFLALVHSLYTHRMWPTAKRGEIRRLSHDHGIDTGDPLPRFELHARCRGRVWWSGCASGGSSEESSAACEVWMDIKVRRHLYN